MDKNNKNYGIPDYAKLDPAFLTNAPDFGKRFLDKSCTTCIRTTNDTYWKPECKDCNEPDYKYWKPIPTTHEAEMNEVELQDDVQQTYDIIKERIKLFLISQVNKMKWFDVEVMGETADAVIVDDLIKIIKSY